MVFLQPFATLLVLIFFVFPNASKASAEDQGLNQAQGQDLELAVALMQADGSSAALEKVAVTIVQQYEAVIRAQHPNIQPEKLEKFNAYLLEEFLNLKPELLHVIAGLYAQYLTTEEIRQLLAFYQTDLGKKSVEAGLQMQEKVYALTFQWGRTAVQRAAVRVHERLKEEGIAL